MYTHIAYYARHLYIIYGHINKSMYMSLETMYVDYVHVCGHINKSIDMSLETMYVDYVHMYEFTRVCSVVSSDTAMYTCM